MIRCSVQSAFKCALASVALIAGIGLGACGGGGGSSGTAAAPASPTLTLTVRSAKTLAFQWGDVADETEYRLLEDASGGGVFGTVATLGPDVTRHELVVPLSLRINARYALQACNASGCATSATIAVGAFNEDSSGAGFGATSNEGLSNAGAVYLY